MGFAIKVMAAGTEIRGSVNTPDFDGKDGWICLSRAAGDQKEIDALLALRRSGVADAYILLDRRTPREATAAEKAAIDAAAAAAALAAKAYNDKP